jgi:hypothetical protein
MPFTRTGRHRFRGWRGFRVGFFLLILHEEGQDSPDQTDGARDQKVRSEGDVAGEPPTTGQVEEDPRTEED